MRRPSSVTVLELAVVKLEVLVDVAPEKLRFGRRDETMMFAALMFDLSVSESGLTD